MYRQNQEDRIILPLLFFIAFDKQNEEWREIEYLALNLKVLDETLKKHISFSKCSWKNL